MKILELNLKGIFFDQILSGYKKEEYREIKDYWFFRLLFSRDYRFNEEYLIREDVYCQLKRGERQLDKDFRFKDYDAVRFSNGYAKDRRQMIVKLNEITMGIGNPLWGATDELTFILKLGEILETKNC